MILKFCIFSNLSLSNIKNLFKLVNSIFKVSILPDSRYLVDKLLNPKDNVEFHSVCPICSNYLGKFGEVEVCPVCNIESNLANPSNTSFFVLINPSRQISDLINIYQNHYDYVIQERDHRRGFIEDVYDGKAYRKFVKSLPQQDQRNYVSAVFNTDGAPKFKCSKYSIWPLYLMLNELPRQDRMTKLVTCGLWFSNKKPEMNVFLDPFVDMINNITRDGILCSIKGEERLLKLHIVSCCVDSVARAPTQGIKQFNGKCGCSWCLHPGQYAENSMRYPLLTYIPKLRNHDETLEIMLQVDPENNFFGIKFPSSLINLSSFDIITGFVPDDMHCCLEGVISQFMDYHLEKMDENQIKMLDATISKITAPHQITRLSRPISLRNDWKARELENYGLYYSIPLLLPNLERKLLDHWILFVESLYILLKDSIHIDELNKADKMLHEFVAKTEKYYGIKAMTYNVHLLLHICTSVLNWGPLWCNSTFCFESANHYLLKAIKCSKGVTQQIVRFVNINHTVINLQERVYRHVSQVVKIYCDDVLQSRLKNVHTISERTYFGRSNYVDDEIRNQLNLSIDSVKYLKVVINGCLYQSSTKCTPRSNNSFAQLSDMRFIHIISFIVDEDGEKEFTVCNIVHTKNCFSDSYKTLQIIEKTETKETILPTNSIERICICMNVHHVQYICPIPNLLHY